MTPGVQRMLAVLAAALLLPSHSGNSRLKPPVHVTTSTGRSLELHAARWLLAAHLHLRLDVRSLPRAEQDHRENLLGLTITGGARVRARVGDSEGVTYTLLLSLAKATGRLMIGHIQAGKG